ncbi:MAG: ATP-binding protein [Acidobacteriota bacterium]|nr:ATP-binding protein [Acidobacteriota bacterium]
MRSVTTRFFAALVAVSLVALALGTWWVQRAVQAHLGGRVIVEQTVERRNGKDFVQERRYAAPGVPAQPDTAGLTRRLLIAMSVVVLGAAAVTALVARRVLGPVRALRDAAEAMAAGRLDARVPETGEDELSALARAFNSMAHALGEQERLKRDLTNDIAHELRTPLTDLRCHVEALQDGVVTATPESLGQLHGQIAHLQRLVDDLGDLARASARQLRLEPESVSVSHVVAQTIQQAAPRAASLGVRVESAVPGGDLTLWGDRARVQQVLSNLLDNALAHTPAGGSVTFEARCAAGETIIELRDTGEGIPVEHLPHVFDRFYRADPSRSRATGGAGLGLAIARQVVEASGGRISAASVPGAGATFEVRWPAFTASS